MVASQIFSSIGIGLLVGLLLGLSTSPVVGLVVGAVTALLSSLLVATPAIVGTGGEEKGKIRLPAADLRLAGYRAGTFGLVCVIGVFLGIYMRTHNVLSPPYPTLREQYDELVGLGFSSEEARKIVIGQSVVDGPTRQGSNESTTGTAKDTVLFAVDTAVCEKIAPDRFENLAGAIDYYRTMRYTSVYTFAETVDRNVADEAAKMTVMQSFWRTLCEK